jgi:hypothetical protein
MERDSIEATDSGKNFRSGQTRFPAHRPRWTQARGMSVRLVNRLFQGYPPERIQTSLGPALKSARRRVCRIPSRIQLAGFGRPPRGGRNRWCPKEHHTRSEDQRSVRENETGVRLCDTEVNFDGNIEERDGIATSLRGIIGR